MNTDKIKGSLKEVAGEVQERFGSLIGSKVQEAKGIALELEGRAQKGLGVIKEIAKDAVDKTGKHGP